MQRKFENVSYSDSDRLAMLENRAAELERRLGGAVPGYAAADRTGAYPTVPHATGQFDATEYDAAQRSAAYYAAAAGGNGQGRATAGSAGTHGYADSGRFAGTGGYPQASGVLGTDGYAASGTLAATGGYTAAGGIAGTDGYAGFDGTGGYAAAGGQGGAGRFAGGAGFDGPGGYGGAGVYDGARGDPGAGGYPRAEGPAADEADERTEVLINRGRRNARRTGPARWLAHWRAVAISVAATAVGATLLAVVLPGGSASWPASVARVQGEITVACQNPNVVSEPSQVNFACAKGTRQILWVFSLLTSGDNPNFTDASNGRKGLEPISPAQGGDVAWSLNLHHPYNPASPTDSLEVAARAINDIIGGATLTGSNGAPEVQPGLESSPANCARYTGSSALVTRQGFPAVCALPVTSPAGQAALASDVFQQWMVGSPSQLATEAGVLFENADNPGDPRVQVILSSLRDSGL